jgi:V/A-type H+-transporting ATPase subunit D
MSLLLLRRRIALARRGHKLLQDKQTQLMKVLLGMLERVKELRRTSEEAFIALVRRYVMARGMMHKEAFESFIATLQRPYRALGEQKKFFTLSVTQPHAEKQGNSTLDYGIIEAPCDFDAVVRQVEALFPLLLELAELEETVDKLSFEIEKTRRRVNALEYILVPSLEETISFITMRLEELERQDLTRLMRVKEILNK